jgi:hypothetical protein
VKKFLVGGGIKLVYMKNFIIRCYTASSTIPPGSFYILSRGRNTGRPAYTPWVNCFVFICKPEERENYYWLVYALWQDGQFHPYLCGSVIEFIHIRDLAQVIETRKERFQNIQKTIALIQKLQQLEDNLHRQLKLIQAGRRQMLKAS